MPESDKIELVRAWLNKARHDLKSAQRLGAGADPLYDTAVFHCQQAAEKAVKACLVFYDQVFGKTHDLRLLIEVAARSQPALRKFYRWRNS
jgi:HEPN domain-containing protein